MKTLFLLRHAKSSWDDPLLADIQRPLAPRGRKAAPRIGRVMARNGWVPDRVLCSSALRAVQTWDLVSVQLDTPIRLEVREDLYHATPSDLLTTLRTLPDSVGSVLLVGHNPTFHDLALGLTGGGREDAVDHLKRKYPTGSLAVFELPVARWGDMDPGVGYLKDFVRPRTLEP